jgi:hypothetical protein
MQYGDLILDPRSIHLGFVLDKVTLGEGFLEVLRVFLVNVTLPVPHPPLVLLYQCPIPLVLLYQCPMPC